VTFLNEVKIAGFRPQPSEENGGDAEKGKKVCVFPDILMLM
jgi:hypothetical protein